MFRILSRAELFCCLAPKQILLRSCGLSRIPERAGEVQPCGFPCRSKRIESAYLSSSSTEISRPMDNQRHMQSVLVNEVAVRVLAVLSKTVAVVGRY